MAASIPPSIACRTWPWELILQAPQASAHAFSYCALMPTALSSYLTKVFDLSTGQILIFPAVAGVLLCSWVSFRLRNEKDWFVRFAPCAILAISWTYNQSHSNCLAAISIMVAVEKLIRSKMLREVLFYCVSILLFAKGGVFLGLIAENFMLQLGLSYGALVSDVIRQSCSFLSVCIVIVMSGPHGCQTIDAHSNYVGR